MESLSDEELRNRLLKLGQRVGPVTPTTREVYLRKLKALQSSKRSPYRNLGGFSSDESDADESSLRGYPSKTTTRGTSFSTTQSRIPYTHNSDEDDNRIPFRDSFEKTTTFSTGWNASPKVSEDMDVGIRRSLDSSLCRPSINGVGQYDYHSPIRNAADSVSEFGHRANNNSSIYQSTINAYRKNDSFYASGGLSSRNRSLCDDDYRPTSTGAAVQRRFNAGRLFSEKDDQNLSSDSFTSMSGSPKRRTVSTHAVGRWQQVSMLLIAVGIGFFLLLGYMYWNMASLQPDLRNNLLLCAEESDDSLIDCIPRQGESWIFPIVKQLVDLLSNRAGEVDCGYEGSRNISLHEFSTFVDEKVGTYFVGKKPELKNMIFKLFIKNPHWSIRLYDSDDNLTTDISAVSYISSEKSQMSLWCRFKLSALRLIYVIVSILTALIAVVLSYLVFRYWRRRREEEMKEVVKLVETIIDKVKQQADASQIHPEIKPYLAIAHVRDSLIPVQDRKKKQHIWHKAVEFISNHESRMRVEDQKIEAEDFLVWHWVSPTADITKVWQGQAFGEHSHRVQNYPPSLATCLKIRNMFDVDMEYGEDWHVSIEDAILEKCGPDHGILHIVVDRASRDGCVFVRCRDLDSAGRAFKALHGWWFDGKLVTVKYLREQRYFERFPEAIHACEPVRPSNTSQSSLSQPFHSSIIETS